MPRNQSYRLQVTGYRACSKHVIKLGIRLVQRFGLYPKSTDLPKRLTGQGFFVRKLPTDDYILGTGCASRLWRDLSVKFSCPRYTQGLLMKLIKESY